MEEEAEAAAPAAPADAPSVVESAFEDDPVVYTTPLYLSQQLAKHLYVLQARAVPAPPTPPRAPGAMARLCDTASDACSAARGSSYVVQFPQVSRLRRLQAPSTARLRPQSELLEVEYNLDPESHNYDSSVDENKRIEKVCYASSVGASKNQYAVLVVKDGVLPRRTAPNSRCARPCVRCLTSPPAAAPAR